MKLNYLMVAALSLAVVMVSCKKDIGQMENTYPSSLGSTGGFTTSNGLPLVSGGEVCIRAWQGNTPLEYNPNASPMGILFPTQNPDPQMEAFIAEDIRQGVDFTQVDSALWITTDTSWTPVPAPYYYAIWTVQLGWTNCDYFYNYAGDKTEITISVPPMFNDQNSMVVCLVDDYNVATQAYHFSNQAFHIDQGYEVPVGCHITFICMADINGTLYWGQVSQEIQDGHITSVIPQIVTQAEFDQKLDALD